MNIAMWDFSAGVTEHAMLGALFSAGLDRAAWTGVMSLLDLPAWSLELLPQDAGAVEARIQAAPGASALSPASLRGVGAAGLPSPARDVMERTLDLLTERLPGLTVDAAGAVAMVGVHVGIAQLNLHRHWRTPLGVAPASLAGLGNLLVGTDLAVLPGHFAGASPLGVALALSLADVHDAPVTFHLQTVGTGAGWVPAGDRASAVPLGPYRVTVAIGSTEAGTDVEQAFEVCATVDDMDPELVPPLMSSLRESGALDAWWSPAVTRGGRPAVTLHALCMAERFAAVRGTILRESTTIGLRYHAVTRHVLPRATRSVETDAGVVTIKESTLPDGSVKWKAELEDCRRVALAAGLTVAQVRELVRKSVDARSTS